jgi:hypothetical protein
MRAARAGSAAWEISRQIGIWEIVPGLSLSRRS